MKNGGTLTGVPPVRYLFRFPLDYCSGTATRSASSSNWVSAIGAGASTMTSRPALFFGKAMKSLMESAPPEERTETVKPESDAPVGRCAVFESVHQESELLSASSCEKPASRTAGFAVRCRKYVSSRRPPRYRSPRSRRRWRVSSPGRCRKAGCPPVWAR